MKKWLPYLLGALGLGLIALLVLAAGNVKTVRRLDERITLKQAHKIPYGTAAATSLLPKLFPEASVYVDAKEPGLWEEIYFSGTNQAVIIVARNFWPDEYEMDRLLTFAEKGNYVFIMARSFSTDAQRVFRFSYSQNILEEFFHSPLPDSMTMRLKSPPFPANESFVYPGKKSDSWFYQLDSLHTSILGTNESGQPNFLKFSRGSGAIFVHGAPLAFSNYFILHKNNIRYFEQALSVIPREVDRVLWNEYYLSKRSPQQEKEPDLFRVLMRYPPFKWGLLTILFALLLYVLLGSRRKQRLIPAHVRPKNESLDFVKTLGRLYHDRRDHLDIARKMAMYFLEYIRTVYKLPTHTLDEKFVEQLQHKSGYPEEGLRSIVSFINSLYANRLVSEEQLADFHRQLEFFYQNT